jgi:anhydro-N-acetylmuramic acid kinase
MQHHILQLAQSAQKATRRIIGLMSGTSLDGLDIALCSITGNGSGTKLVLEQFATEPFEEAFKNQIRAIFAKPQIDFATLTVLNVQVADKHAALIHEALTKWQISPNEIDCIASHGQTVFHAPRAVHGRADWPHATLQIGDGDHLAHQLGITVISDFRQKHIAAGGEGAPLALYGDYYLFSQPNEERFLLNMGGIANFTYLPADGNTTKAIATDTGPGNTLLDAVAQRDFNQSHDQDSILALNGTLQEGLLNLMLEHTYFIDLEQCLTDSKPKTTGPEMFGLTWLDTCLAQWPKGSINPFDLMATLSHFSAHSIARGVKAIALTSDNKHIYMSGGGAHNPLIVNTLKELLPDFQFHPMSDLGMNGDAKEACLFAILANETLAGKSQDMVLGGVPLVGMGKISFPE